MKRCVFAMIVVALLAGPSMANEPPAIMNSAVLWLDAGVGVGTDAKGNLTWQDQATGTIGGHDIGGLFTVPGFSTSPTFNADALNGLPAIYFDGNVLRGESPYNNNTAYQQMAAQLTVFFVLVDVKNMIGLFDSAHGKGAALRFFRTNSLEVAEDTLFPIALGDTTDGVLFGFTHSGALGNDANWENGTGNARTLHSYINGEEQETAFVKGQVVGWFEPQLGAINDGNDPFKGGIAEVIIFNSVLSDGDRQAVEAYLMGKYGIVPEPATMTLLAMGGLALLRRRA